MIVGTTVAMTAATAGRTVATDGSDLT